MKGVAVSKHVISIYPMWNDFWQVKAAPCVIQNCITWLDTTYADGLVVTTGALLNRLRKERPQYAVQVIAYPKPSQG